MTRSTKAPGMPVEAEEVVEVEEAVEKAVEVAEVTEMAAMETETTRGITNKILIRKKRLSRPNLCANRREPISQTSTTSPPSDAECLFTAFNYY
jgi:hypothetical protein